MRAGEISKDYSEVVGNICIVTTSHLLIVVAFYANRLFSFLKF